MKRSQINGILTKAKAFMAERRFYLPPWAYWEPDEWKKNKLIAIEVIDNMLGWDITDFGSGDFNRRGLFLFTIRNGKFKADNKPYAEKIMIVEENQETPLHHHWSKMEDIINRGGGNLVVELFNADENNKPDNSDVMVRTDGLIRKIRAGESIILTPGESVCLEKHHFHRFYGQAGKGKVLVGEVSAVNDDNTDNCFLEDVGRFPEIIEDEEPLHLLVSDYNKFLK